MSDELCFVIVLCFSIIIILLSRPFANENIVRVLLVFMILVMSRLVSIIFQIRKIRRSKAESNASLAIPYSL